MFYAASSELANNSQWNTASLEKSFKIWVAQYPSMPYPETSSTSYTGTCSMWQYTNQGRVAGIGTMLISMLHISVILKVMAL